MYPKEPQEREMGEMGDQATPSVTPDFRRGHQTPAALPTLLRRATVLLMADLRETQKLGQATIPGLSAARAASRAWLSTEPPASHAFTRASERPCTSLSPTPSEEPAGHTDRGDRPAPHTLGPRPISHALCLAAPSAQKVLK